MPIILTFDTETTGLDPVSGHRVIEVALLSYDLNTRTLLDKYVQRIDPERPIDPKAQAVHGITYAMLATCPKFRDVASLIHRRFVSCDAIVAHNLPFDEAFLKSEFALAGLTFPEKHAVDTAESRWATMDGKTPKLQELAFSLGVPYNASLAHAAEYDTSVLAECFWRGLDRGFYQLPGMKVAA